MPRPNTRQFRASPPTDDGTVLPEPQHLRVGLLHLNLRFCKCATIERLGPRLSCDQRSAWLLSEEADLIHREDPFLGKTRRICSCGRSIDLALHVPLIRRIRLRAWDQRCLADRI